MELLYQLPEPEDLDRDECAASLHGLRDEIKKLHDKYGSQAAAALKEVEHIIRKYEANTNDQEQQARAEKHLLAKHKVQLNFFASIFFMTVFAHRARPFPECGSSNNSSSPKYSSSILKTSQIHQYRFVPFRLQFPLVPWVGGAARSSTHEKTGAIFPGAKFPAPFEKTFS
jgi:hypothetical protein